jgi:mannose-6-phosphate isomerase-like protein (cupin superfamily)
MVENNKNLHIPMKFVKKGWGYEKWIINKNLYCGKLLFFNAGKKCSWHYHVEKDEVFYLQSGKMIVRYSEQDNLDECETIILEPGMNFYIYPGLRHQMEALENSELFEFSTEHFDEDSYRVIKGD